MTKTRLEAFSDAVIAIIITIMVLELKPIHGIEWKDIKPHVPIFISYAFSFLMLGIYWGNHHHLVHTIREVGGGIIWANLHLLFWLSLIPFATAWMGENEFKKITIAAYAFLLGVCGISYYILLLVMKSNNRNNEQLLDLLRKQSRKGMISVIMYAAAFGIAFKSGLIAGILIVLVAIMWLIPDRNIERSLKE